MKTNCLTVTASALCVVVSSLTGCAFRDAKMYADDTTKVLTTKQDDIKACYDGVLKTTPKAAGKVTVTFDVETEQGKLVNVAVDKANTTASDALAECVTKSLQGLAVSPPDRKTGQATFVYEFNVGAAPAVAPAAPRS